MAALTGSLTLSKWINKENALAAYRGLHLNRYWERWVTLDNSTDQKPSSYSPVSVTMWVSYNLFGAFNQIEYILSPERVTSYKGGYFPDPRGPYFYAALFLAVLNAAKFFREANNQPPPEEKRKAHVNELPAQSTPTPMDKFLVVISKATPYLMIITNIAVTIIQIRRGDSSGLVTLAFTGITLIDITPLKPKDYMSYVNTVLGYPVVATALYYGNNRLRFQIVRSLTLSYILSRPIVQDGFKKISKLIGLKTSLLRQLIDCASFGLWDVLQDEESCELFFNVGKIKISINSIANLNVGVNFMATSSASLGTWVNEKNAFAAYNGLYRNRLWEGLIISNKSADQKNMPNPLIDGLRTYYLFTTFSRVEHVLSPERVTNNGYFPDPRGPYFYAALLLVVLNVAKSLMSQQAQLEEKNRSKHNPNNAPLKQPEPTAIGQFLIVVSQATPYLMIITNIAVNIIQIQRGESSAWIELAFTGITLIDISSWKPENYEWYRDTVLGYPVSAVVFYYANNKLRLSIMGSLALKTETVKKLMQNPAQTQLRMRLLLKRYVGI